MEKLDEANILSSEIRELKYFINTLDVSGISRTKPNTTSIIKKTTETKTTYSIFGRRFYGIGAHEHTINVPTSVIPSIVNNAKDLLEHKQDEFNSLFA